MRIIKRAISLFVLVAVMLVALSGCLDKEVDAPAGPIEFKSYKDIPGVTEKEIAEIEAIREQFNYFTYGMLLSTETFIGGDGKISGYTALFCKWLTELFGIPFVPEIVTWEQIADGLRSGDIDFTGSLTATDERRQTYFMTDAIAQRTVKYFELAGREHSGQIMIRSMPRYALIRGSVHGDNVLRYANEPFEPVYISDHNEAYDLMRNGEVDALLAESSTEAIFDAFGDVVARDFFPLLHAPVSLTAQNPALEPIIAVVQKALEHGGTQQLTTLYDKGHHQYLSHKLYMQLTDEELEYIRKNPVIPFAAEYENYPVSFFDARDDERWQGISLDVLSEIGALSGLSFEIVNDEAATFPELLEMLESGEAYMLSEVIQTPERANRFLWPDNSFTTEWSVLISKANYPNISINRIYSHRVGMTKGSAHTEFFQMWFPNHKTLVYDNQHGALDALMRDEVDLIIASNSFYLYLTNYLELPDYKANIIFENNFESTFGINKDQQALRSIVDKSLALIDTKTITEQWRLRTYDYRLMLAQAEMDAQRPWLIGTSILILCVFLLLLILFIRRRGEEQRLEDLVKKRTAEVEAANNAKSAFLSTMSHEIRTPMNAILGITEIQLQRDTLDADTRIAIERIYTSGDLLLGIINDILDLSKIEAGKLELLLDRYEIASLVSDTAQLNMMRVGSRRVSFELNVEENMPAQFIGDELRVKQIMNNLLSNAFKYTLEGSVVLSVSTEDSKDDNDEIILIVSVRDTGPGMSEEQVSKLFDEYTRFNMETNRSTEGTGLGMSITKNLIRLMGGVINVESELGKGSTFTVHLPQRRSGDETLGVEMVENLRQFRTSNRAQMKRAQITRDPMPYGSILVVDDVETNIYVAKGLFAPYELRIDSAPSGYAAIEKIKSGKTYDIIFMDHMMPEMDGIDATKRIREMGYDQPIVALTANAVAGQAGIFLGNGFDDFISKPIDLRQMNLLLNKMIRDKQPPEVIEAARQASVVKQDLVTLPRQADDFEFVRVFVNEAEKSLHTLRVLTENSGWQDNEDDMRVYIIHIHTIKSALANIGKLDLSAIALKLEQAARNRIIEIVTTESPMFFSLLDTYLKNLRLAAEEAKTRAGLSVTTKQIGGLDIFRGLEQVSGNETAYLQILHSYAANVRSLLTTIESLPSSEESEEKKLARYKITVHGLKGTSYYVFADEIGRQAEALEKAAGREDTDYISKHNPVFLEAAWKLVSDLEVMLSEFDAENPRPVKPEPDRELLVRIRDACKRFNMDELDAAMEEIERYQYDSDDGFVNWLQEAVHRMDMTGIVNRLTDMLS